MLKSPFVILSAERAELAADANARRTEILRQDLEDGDLVPVPVTGHWNGIEERSFAVELEADRYVAWHVANLANLAARFQQDAILYVQWNGRATLVTNAADASTDVDLGVWREIDAVHAATLSGYSQIGARLYAAV